ncbi:hypothetical protein [Nostoc sp. KVJ20]|uniref:hypothetical protein n=1 Tax=Nostoc sp. KVJ20 TaxID=457944 RepID=UPI00159EF586|nr:hypothetical protein [Nostoc sp. KVJ20]
MNFQAALTPNKFITSAADQPDFILFQQTPAALTARMTDTVKAKSPILATTRCLKP